MPCSCLGAGEQQTCTFAVGRDRDTDVAEDAQAAEADLEGHVESVDDGAGQVDAGAGIAVGDEREVARAEVAEVVLGSELAQAVRDFAKEFLYTRSRRGSR